MTPSTRYKPLTNEEKRILRAALDERLIINASGRWIIAGEHRPDRRARQALRSKLLIQHPRREDGSIDWGKLVPAPAAYNREPWYER